MLKPMRVPVLLLTSLVLALSPPLTRAQGSDPAEVVRAYQLWTGGLAKAAIALLEPLLQPTPQGFTDSDPVSYTHLDVYKRQVQEPTNFATRHFVASFYPFLRER